LEVVKIRDAYALGQQLLPPGAKDMAAHWAAQAHFVMEGLNDGDSGYEGSHGRFAEQQGGYSPAGETQSGLPSDGDENDSDTNLPPPSDFGPDDSDTHLPPESDDMAYDSEGLSEDRTREVNGPGQTDGKRTRGSFISKFGFKVGGSRADSIPDLTRGS
jgi:hypothetical protein